MVVVGDRVYGTEKQGLRPRARLRPSWSQDTFPSIVRFSEWDSLLAPEFLLFITV